MPANFEVVFVASGRYWPILLAPEGPRPGRVVTNLRMFVGLWANGQTRPRSISAPVPTKAVDLRKRRRFMVSTSLAQCCFGEYAWDLGRELHELTSRAKQGIGALSAIAGKGRFFVTFVLRKANRIFFPTTSFTCLRRSLDTTGRPGEGGETCTCSTEQCSCTLVEFRNAVSSVTAGGDDRKHDVAPWICLVKKHDEPDRLAESRAHRVAAKLRPGNVHSADGWKQLLLPEIERLQKLGKEVWFRADAPFANPDIYETLEERGANYAIRIPANDCLLRDIAELLIRPVGRPGRTPVVWYKGFLYRAASWTTALRVVAKGEVHAGELFPRLGFIVTNTQLANRKVVHLYNQRGMTEQWIKEGKQAVKMTRLSCHRFRSNEVRLWLRIP